MGGEGNDAFGQNIGGTDVGGSGALTFLSAWTGATPGTMPDTEWLTGGNSAFASFVFYDPSSVISAHVLVSTTPVLLGGAAGSTPTLDLQGANQEIASLADVAGAAVKGVVTNSAPDMPVVLTLGALTGMTEYSGAIEGNISLVKNGGSTQSLTGSLTYTGDTTVNGGTLIVNDLNMPSSTISVMDGAVLEARSIVADTLSIGGTPLVNAAPPAAVPEPGTLILLTLAAIGMLLAIRRK
jgi:fibronectin-binding autotransporter adhesin